MCQWLASAIGVANLSAFPRETIPGVTDGPQMVSELA